MTLMERRRDLMAQKATDSKEYLIKDGVIQPILGTFSAKGFIRGGGNASVTEKNGYLEIKHASGTTASETASNLVMPNGHTKVKFTANLEQIMSNADSRVIFAESVKTGTSYNAAYTNYVSVNVQTDTRTEYEKDISAYQNTGFYLSITMDTWASKFRALQIYDMWMD